MTTTTADQLLEEYRVARVNPDVTFMALEVAALLEAAGQTGDHELNEAMPAALTKLFDATGNAINSTLKKLGLHAHKGNKSLLAALAQATKPVAKLFWLALKAQVGGQTPEMEEAIKAALKDVKKADWMELMLKLDTLSLHLITGPIHMIDALTGWHIGADLHHGKTASQVVLSAREAIAHAIEDLKNGMVGSGNDIRDSFAKYVKALRDMLVSLPDNEELAKAGAA